MATGKFITIEGCEGVGKSTQILLLKEYCVDNNIDAVFTREPGGTHIAEKIRSIILDADNIVLDDLTELLLYSASRRQHVKELIEPSLKAGKLVFCDRFIDSTLAYQGHARGIDKQIIEKLNNLVLGDVNIDCTIFLDLEPSLGFLRKGGADTKDRLESQGIEFFDKVYGGFKELASQNLQRFEVIDASFEQGEVHLAILSRLKHRGILH